MSDVENPEAGRQARLGEHKQQLGDYGLRGLEGRMQHGLDPAAMLAVHEVRAKVEALAAALGGDMARLDALTKELHVGGVWKNAQRLAEASEPEVMVWHVLGGVCHEKNAAQDQLDDSGYLADVERVKAVLTDMSADLDRVKAVIAEHVQNARNKFEIVDGVAYAEGEFPFLNMAIGGERSGVWKDGELYFVGADAVDFESLAGQGYTKEEREDRGRKVTFWTKDGQDAVKQLYPGFGIVLNGDKNLALELAKTA